MRSDFLACACRCVAFIFLLGASVLGEPPRYHVAGIINHVPGEEWEDVGIGFGLANLLSQELYDSGLFVPLEEKEEIRREVEDTRRRLWNLTGEAEDGITFSPAPLEADLVFWGEVMDCRSHKTKVLIGLFTRYKRTVQVRVRVVMKEQNGDLRMIAEGEGTSDKGATAVVFETRDGSIDFNSTMTGMASSDAVRNAVRQLVGQYKKERNLT